MRAANGEARQVLVARSQQACLEIQHRWYLEIATGEAQNMTPEPLAILAGSTQHREASKQRYCLQNAEATEYDSDAVSVRAYQGRSYALQEVHAAGIVDPSAVSEAMPSAKGVNHVHMDTLLLLQ